MAGLGGVSFKRGPNKDKHKSAVCKGLNSSGKNKGRLKKGWKWKTGGGGCPIPAKSSDAPKRTKRKSTKKGGTGPNLAKLCAGLHSSGKKKGKLKKGFKFSKSSKCPVTAKSKR